METVFITPGVQALIDMECKRCADIVRSQKTTAAWPYSIELNALLERTALAMEARVIK